MKKLIFLLAVLFCSFGCSNNPAWEKSEKVSNYAQKSFGKSATVQIKKGLYGVFYQKSAKLTNHPIHCEGLQDVLLGEDVYDISAKDSNDLQSNYTDIVQFELKAGKRYIIMKYDGSLVLAEIVEENGKERYKLTKFSYIPKF